MTKIGLRFKANEWLPVREEDNQLKVPNYMANILFRGGYFNPSAVIYYIADAFEHPELDDPAIGYKFFRGFDDVEYGRFEYTMSNAPVHGQMPYFVSRANYVEGVVRKGKMFAAVGAAFLGLLSLVYSYEVSKEELSQPQIMYSLDQCRDNKLVADIDNATRICA